MKRKLTITNESRSLSPVASDEFGLFEFVREGLEDRLA